MPLNRPALTLGPGPRAVHEARRWVVETCREVGRPELADCAELGVSELATNALLHGEAPIQVRFRGTVEHPRVEVRDQSPEPPVLPTEHGSDEGDPGDPDDELLLTFGRGLSIVARSADAWGAELEPDGKTVWFAPAAEFAEGDGVPGVITGAAPAPAARVPQPDDVTVTLLGVPLREYDRFEAHLRELRREVRLLSLAHEEYYPLAKNLSNLFGDLEREVRDIIGGEQVRASRGAGVQAVDLQVVLARPSLGAIAKLTDMLDLADEFARQERLLSLARTPAQREFQTWFLGEAVRQGAGEPPTAWRDASSARHSSVS